MVNTFIVSHSFSKSARRLDRQRLCKQRVEAVQILCNCIKLNHWAKYYNLELTFWRPEMQDVIASQITQIRKRVKGDLNNGLVHLFDSLTNSWTIIQKIPKVKIPCYKSWDICDGGNIRFCDKEYLRYDVKLPNDIVGTLGFVSHPIVKMWLGFEENLKYYINCHIEEWTRREYKNNMPTLNYTIVKENPSWINKNTFKLHKAILLQKEIERNEPEWYSKKKSFVHYYKHLTGNGLYLIDWIWF